MRIERRNPRLARAPLGMIFGGLLLISIVVAGVWIRLGLPSPVCNLRDWTGVPCPSCGTSRMARALFAGRVGEALRWNPMMFAAFCAGVVWAIYSTITFLLRLPEMRIRFEGRERGVLGWSALVVFLAGWAYLIWRGV